MSNSKHLLIKGKVQGVFYRASAKDTAELLGITGWIKNTPDGNVEIVCQGNEKDIQQFIEWCKTGPPRARVAKVEVTDVDTEGFTGFNIVRRSE